MDIEYINRYDERIKREDEKNLPLLISLFMLVFILIRWFQVHS